MQSSNKPKNLTMPFAAGGAFNPIPTDSQVGVSPGKASMIDGFPPATRTPRAAGGVPPDGLDMNGILHDISNAVMYQQAFGILPWDSDFATATGYPKDAIVNYNGLLYQSLNEDNKAAPTNATAWGAVKGVTPAAVSNDKSIATTEFVNAAIKKINPTVDISNIGALVNAAVKSANPQFSGTSQLGYVRLPSGIIQQWGTTTVLESEGRSKIVNLPIPFPNRGFVVNANDFGSWCAPVGCTFKDNASIKLFRPTYVFIDETSSPSKIGDLTIHWHAIGY